MISCIVVAVWDLAGQSGALSLQQVVLSAYQLYSMFDAHSDLSALKGVLKVLLDSISCKQQRTTLRFGRDDIWVGL